MCSMPFSLQSQFITSPLPLELFQPGPTYHFTIDINEDIHRAEVEKYEIMRV